MERLIERRIGRTFSKYELVENTETNQQNSYNLSLDAMRKLLNAQAIEEFEPNHYKVSPNYQLVLGNNVLLLIDEFSNEERNVIFTHTLANDGTEKFQIKRTDNLSEEMSWFGKLYDRNCKDSVFVIDLDEDNHKVIIENYLLDEFYSCIGKIPEEIDDGNIPYETLIANLKTWMRQLPIENKKMASLTAYIFQYAKSIINADVSAENILSDAELETTLTPYVNVALTLYKAVSEGKIILSTQDKKTNKTSKNINDSKNIILYGVPGCGKSFTIARDYCDDKNYMERIVFHPDYSYADFVGQILPSNVGGQISYPFKPGPFTRMLKKANHDVNNNYYLIIEEINRGNAPAIFGDVFQLLDRTDDGVSVYPISNEEIAKEAYDGDANAEIKLPSNLYILATMNTADQNVFTLDTAFKRRWKFKSIENDVEKCDFADKQILDTKVSWKEFVKKLNSTIIAQSKSSIGNEDKRLGAWFVKEEDLSNKEQFGSKILMYLWNDVFKYNPEQIFNVELLEEKTLDCLIKKFNEIEFEIFNKNNINFVQSNFESSNRINVTDELLENYNSIGVSIYKKLVEELKERIPSFKDVYFTNSDYFQFQADDIKRAGFVDIGMTKRISRIQINIELPTEEKLNKFINDEIGCIPGGNKWSHKFLLELQNESDLTDDVISAIYDSYESLKR